MENLPCSLAQKNSTISSGASYCQKVNHQRDADLEINRCRPIRTAAWSPFYQEWNRRIGANHTVYRGINLSTHSDRAKSHEERVYPEALNTTIEQNLEFERTYEIELLKPQ